MVTLGLLTTSPVNQIPRQMSVRNRTWLMRSEISFQDVPLSAIDVPGSSFFWREEKGRRCVQAGPHPAWPQAFDEAAVVSGREVRAQDEPHVEWPQLFDGRAVVSGRWAQARSAQPR